MDSQTLEYQRDINNQIFESIRSQEIETRKIHKEIAKTKYMLMGVALLTIAMNNASLPYMYKILLAVI
jgi:hypothetical protein